MTTGWVSHELYMWHDSRRATAMSPDRKLAAWAASVGGQDLQPHQDDIIRQAERLVSRR